MKTFGLTWKRLLIVFSSKFPCPTCNTLDTRWCSRAMNGGDRWVISGRVKPPLNTTASERHIRMKTAYLHWKHCTPILTMSLYYGSTLSVGWEKSPRGQTFVLGWLKLKASNIWILVKTSCVVCKCLKRFHSAQKTAPCSIPCHQEAGLDIKDRKLSFFFFFFPFFFSFGIE